MIETLFIKEYHDTENNQHNNNNVKANETMEWKNEKIGDHGSEIFQRENNHCNIIAKRKDALENSVSQRTTHQNLDFPITTTLNMDALNNTEINRSLPFNRIDSGEDISSKIENTENIKMMQNNNPIEFDTHCCLFRDAAFFCYSYHLFS